MINSARESHDINTVVDTRTSREVTVAVAMNGGVSLAVWIGGVATEVYRCHHADGIYGRLQKALDCHVRVDVISGASAGGLNGILLGTAIARDLPVVVFDRLKQTWLQVGDFLELLRDPLNRNPPSLMKGNEVFLPQVERLVRSWLADVPDSSEHKLDLDLDLDLYLTTTPLQPSALAYGDALGSYLREPVTRGAFQFSGKDFDDANDEAAAHTLARRLALAARSSASFPGAFEPAYIRIGGNAPEKRHPTADIDMSGFATFTSSKWVTDGGVLVNKPVGPALNLIKKKRTRRDARRVLLYVVPDPGTGPEDVPSELTSQPSMASVVTKSLLTLPRAESIAGDLQSIRTHNRAARRHLDVRRRLLVDKHLRDAIGATGQGLWPFAERLYPMWRLSRDHYAVDERIDRFLELSDGDRSLRVGGGQSYTWQEVIDKLTLVRQEDSFLPELGGVTNGSESVQWRYGHRPLVEACEELQTLAADVQRHFMAELSTAPAETGAIEEALRAVSDKLAHIDRVNSSYWEQALTVGPTQEEREARAFATRLFKDWPVALRADTPNGVDPNQKARAALASDLGRDKPDELTPEQWQPEVRQLEHSLAEQLKAQQTLLVNMMSTRTGHPDSEAKEIHVKLLHLQDRPGQPLLSEHLALHIAETLVDSGERAPRPIDFIQISADTDCPADPTRIDPTDKVTGLQLGHFGAFYKESWRANDWMWGRIDGAKQLIGMLLQPEQIRRNFQTHVAAAKALAKAAGVSGWTPERGEGPKESDADAMVRAALWRQSWPAVSAELDAIFDEQKTTPTTLNATAAAIARIAQLEIAQTELADVAASIARSREAGGNTPRRTRSFEIEVDKKIRTGHTLSLSDAQRLLPLCDVGRERIGGEVGSDLLTSATATTAAIAVTALSGEGSGTGVISPLFRSIRTAVITAYLVALNAVRRTRTAFALTQLLLAFGGATIAVDVLGGDVPSPVLVLAYVAMVAWATVTAVTVGAWATVLPLVIAIVLIGAALIGEDRAAELFSESDPDGWKATQAHWAWVVPAAVGGLMAIFFKLRTRELLRKLTLPEVRTRVQKIWSRRLAAEDSNRALFDALLDGEISTKRERINRSKRAMWLSILGGGLLALVARPLYRWIFLHPGGHDSWITVCEWFGRYRVPVVILTIGATTIALSLYRLVKLSVTGRKTGAVARWRPLRWAAGSLVRLRRRVRDSLTGSLARGSLGTLARRLGFGELGGVSALVWFTRRAARGYPCDDAADQIAQNPASYEVTLVGGPNGDVTENLQTWLERGPGTQRVRSLHDRITGELIPRAGLSMGQRNTRVARFLRRVPGLRKWGRIQHPAQDERA
ncbi:MAG: patatin-like protein [Aeromicrobium sp.]